MTGSSLFSILVGRFSVEKLGVGIFAVGAIAMISVALHINETVSFMGMNVFEVCVGTYFPVMGTMKGSIVPESKRAAIYNLYRIPLNLIVVISLLADPEPAVAFAINFVMLSVAAVLQVVLAVRRTESNEAIDRVASRTASIENAPLIEEDRPNDPV
jgi:MFS transporter, MFS domain-containing protein family, molybdate-anion transporter